MSRVLTSNPTDAWGHAGLALAMLAIAFGVRDGAPTRLSAPPA